MRGTVDPHSIQTRTTKTEHNTWKTRSLFPIDKHTNTESKIFATILEASYLYVLHLSSACLVCRLKSSQFHDNANANANTLQLWKYRFMG